MKFQIEVIFWGDVLLFEDFPNTCQNIDHLRFLAERDKQSKNSIKIAEDAGRLYDKFVDFVADVQGVQDAIVKAGTAANNAMKKLQAGTGNLISRSENLRKLGAKAKKQIKLSEDLDDDESDVKPSEAVRPLTTDQVGSAEALITVRKE